MAHSPVNHDRGTRFTNYSSIHSADAFVGDYQVMYTPGSTSPQLARPAKRSTRFGRAPSSSKPQQNISQSYLLPSNMPNTSQIMPDQGHLPNVQVHYSIPADEKQIVASLRSLQRDLNEAMQTINELAKERDAAVHELRLLKATSRKASLPSKKRHGRSVEEELFDLSSPLHESPKRSANRETGSKKESKQQKQPTVSDEARVLSPVPINAALGRQSDKRTFGKSLKENSKHHKHQALDDTEQSMVEENPTAASNTSRRRRRTSVDENMTSAYILPDITVDQQVQNPAKMSKATQHVLHNLEPEHVANCDVCHRLTTKSKPQIQNAHRKNQFYQGTNITDFAKEVTKQPDYTAALAGFADESLLADPTLRPKMSPAHALARVKVLMEAQFKKAKERHRIAWEKYDSIEAPLSSKKHSEVSKEMQHWAEKMEECRVHLDYLRDVEEGMSDDA